MIHVSQNLFYIKKYLPVVFTYFPSTAKIIGNFNFDQISSIKLHFWFKCFVELIKNFDRNKEK